MYERFQVQAEKSTVGVFGFTADNCLLTIASGCFIHSREILTTHSAITSLQGEHAHHFKIVSPSNQWRDVYIRYADTKTDLALLRLFEQEDSAEAYLTIAESTPGINSLLRIYALDLSASQFICADGRLGDIRASCPCNYPHCPMKRGSFTFRFANKPQLSWLGAPLIDQATGHLISVAWGQTIPNDEDSIPVGPSLANLHQFVYPSY